MAVDFENCSTIVCCLPSPNFYHSGRVGTYPWPCKCLLPRIPTDTPGQYTRPSQSCGTHITFPQPLSQPLVDPPSRNWYKIIKRIPKGSRERAGRKLGGILEAVIANNDHISSAGGPDGLTPQHLKDLTGPSAKEGGHSLLLTLTSFIQALSSEAESLHPYALSSLALH